MAENETAAELRAAGACSNCDQLRVCLEEDECWIDHHSLSHLLRERAEKQAAPSLVELLPNDRVLLRLSTAEQVIKGREAMALAKDLVRAMMDRANQ